MAVTAGVALVLRWRRSRPGSSRRLPASVVGAIVAVDSRGLGDVRGFTLRDPGWRPAEFDLPRLENGAEFPPGHLVEHQATAEPVRVWFREEGGDPLRDPARGRARLARLRTVGSTSSIAASISSSPKMSMNDAVTMPRPSTTKTHGSAASRHSVVAGAGVRAGGSPVRTGWSCPASSLSSYGSTLMKVTSGWAAAMGLSRSRVGPHWAVAQNFGVANASTNGFAGGQRVA